MPRVQGALEEISHWAFDTLVYVDNVTSALVFFQQTLAQGAQNTNMKTAGAFPTPEQFNVRTVRVGFLLNTLLADIRLLYNGSPTLTLEVGAKRYLDGVPLEIFTMGFKLEQAGDRTDAAAVGVFAGSGNPDSVLTLPKPVKINPNEPFSVTLRWATPVNTTANVTMRVVLGGILNRAVQ